MRVASAAPAPYTEPGLDLAGATYLGAASLTTPSDPTGSLPILITLAFSNGSRLNALLQNLSDPASPEYHHYLTAAEFDSEFGAASSVYNSLVGYLASYGVNALTTYSDRLTISFEATPSETDGMFRTSLGTFVTASGEAYYAPTSTPLIPVPLAPYVVDVEGLSNYSEYLDHLAPLASLRPLTAGTGADTADGGVRGLDASSTPVAPAGPSSPGSIGNPFASTTVTSNGLTNTYDRPVDLNLSGKSGSCDTNFCGDFVQAPDLQVTYNETGLFQKYGYPVNASVAAILWSDPICHSDSGNCSSDGLYNYYCSTLTDGDSAWDFFMPDVTSFWNYSIPSGEPKPTAYSMAETGYTYAYPAASQGYSASCDDGGAETENTLDVDMLGSLAPGANVFQVFGGANTVTAVDTAFADILSPSSSDFSTDGGFDTAASVAKLENVSVITNSWTNDGTLPAAWTSDLETAQARGVTVLGATGDSGTTVEPPAEIGDNTYGAVAVSGTTAAINLTTLLRGPPHLATGGGSSTGCKPYCGVGTGEIGWYEPAGTVDGFSSTYGGTGGVATSTTYYRATWFNASADAVGVADLVSSGNYRAEPDVAAIANDTILDLDEGPYSLNFTCWVTPSCTSISKLAVGTSPGSSPTVEETYVIGTSVATPVTGGLVATIDYGLETQHEGRLGFLDPAAYPMGQKEYSGELTLRPFYDVAAYTDGGGSSTTYEAKTGYDLATGWGVLDAGNYTQNTMTYNTTFTERGLPSGTSWSVTVTPTLGDANCTVSGGSCSNSATRSSTSTTNVFPEAYGVFNYTVSSAGNDYSAAGGSFDVRGMPGSEQVSFSPVAYPVTFTESGLPSGTAWSVNISGSGSHGGTAGSPISFSEPDGSYNYTLNSANRSWSASGGSFSVAGAGVTESVAFHLVTFGVSFTESGLPSGLTWAVTFNGTLESVTTGVGPVTLRFPDEPNGTYGYLIGELAGWREGGLPAAGTLSVAGAPVSVNVSYREVTYNVTFSETGLPAGTEWFLNVTGGGSYAAFAGSGITLKEPNGTWSYTLGSANTSWEGPGGSFTVDGAPASELVTFERVTYPVAFSESGLPSGDSWYVNVSGGPALSTTGATTSLTADLPNGTYSVTVATNDNTYAPSYGTAKLAVSGAAVAAPPITFTEVGYSVTFSEKGLPGGTGWSVTINSVTQASTSKAITFREANGTYSYTASVTAGGSTVGSLVVKGAPLTRTVAFYQVTFGETGLPARTSWQMTTNGVTLSSTTSVITFYLANGTYTYLVGPISGYRTTASGTFTVKGSAVIGLVQFVATT